MMSPCPDLSTLDDLHVLERDAHLNECPPCRALFAMRDGGDEEFGKDCQQVELLLAVAESSPLSAVDERRMSRHLSGCGRCESLAAELLLTQPDLSVPDAPAQLWQHAREEQPANDQKRKYYIFVAAVAVAATLVLFLRDTQDTQAPEPHAELIAEPMPAQILAPVHADAGVAVTPDQVGASRPVPQPDAGTKKAPKPERTPKVPFDQAELDSLLKRAAEEIKNTQFGMGLASARKALAMAPDNQKAVMTAVIAACNLGDAKISKKYLARLKSPSRRAGVGQICKRLGVWDEPVEKEAETINDELVGMAAEAIKDSQYGKGLRLCGKALEQKPKSQRAIMTCTIAACNLKKAALAKKYFQQLSSASRQAGVRQICWRLGVPGFED